MKKFIFSAAALMLATTFSFAGTPETKSKAEPATTTASAGNLHWYVMSGTSPVFQNTATTSDEQAITGCSGPSSKPECERGYRDDQLNTPGNPSAGVKPSQVNAPDSKIYRTN